MDIIIILVLTLCVVILIPWMIRRDFQKRMLGALRDEILTNIERIQEYVLRLPEKEGGLKPGEETGAPVLAGTVFRKMQREDFRSKVLSNKDRDDLETILEYSFRHTGNTTQNNNKDIYAGQVQVLEGILGKIESSLNKK